MITYLCCSCEVAWYGASDVCWCCLRRTSIATNPHFFPEGVTLAFLAKRQEERVAA